MQIDDVSLSFVCGADWGGMKAIDSRARLCAQCDKIVHDLSAMDEEDARRLLASRSKGLCVRYLFDPQTGQVAFQSRKLVPTASLVRPGMKRALSLAAPLLLQACMGALPSEAIDDSGAPAADAGPDGHAAALPTATPPDAGDAGDADPDGAATPDGGAAGDAAAKSD